MKLYFSPGACSLAVHIALREAQIPFQLVAVDLATHETGNGTSFQSINPKGYVPALQWEDGGVLTENQVILQYVADQRPDAGLAPPAGTAERYRLMEWLAFIATEIHKGFGPLWNPHTPDVTRHNAVTQLGRRFDFVAAALADLPWLMGEGFSVADAYLFTVLRWTDVHGIELLPWPVLVDYFGRVHERPAVAQALLAEGLT